MLHKLSAAILFIGFVLSQHVAWGADPQRFSILLRQQGKANDRDLKLYSQSGVAFAEILPPIRPGEVAAAGAVRVPVTVDFFIDRFHDIQTFKQGTEILAIGKFSDPPREQDLAGLTLEDKALNSLPACRPGKCPLKLSAEMINRLRAIAATSGRTGLNSGFRALLLSYVMGYMKKGTPAMIAYTDTDPPVQAAIEFLEILGQFAWLEKDAPQLLGALRDSLRTGRPAIDDFFYWSKESFGLKPVASVTQVLIFRTTVEGKPWAFIASKQIFADHYFEASLGLTVLAAESADPAKPSVSVAYFNRSRTDGLRGWLGSLERSIVERRARAGMIKTLSELRDRLAGTYQK